MTISVDDNESSKYWLSVLNERKNRGVKDVLVICADGLTGIKEAIAAAFPRAEYQRRIVHQGRNSLTVLHIFTVAKFQKGLPDFSESPIKSSFLLITQ